MLVVVPTRSERRKYFDSGDFALSQAHSASDMGHIQTGIDHQLCGSMSHPSFTCTCRLQCSRRPNKQNKGMEKVNKAEETSNLHKQANVNIIKPA